MEQPPKNEKDPGIKFDLSQVSSAQDKQEFLRIEQELKSPTYIPLDTIEDAEKELQRGPLLLVKNESRTIGIAGYEIKESVPYINALGFSPEFQRKGLGRAVMERLFAEYPEFKNAQRVQLRVDPTNEAALRLYESLGFKETERTEDWRGVKGATRILMTWEKPQS
ncbi:MAG TPA: N-acetyltransferase [Candidatus Paceibacterota bacterium]|nr:N-acetyltransferase [Candidatus Paceibacterota bacterium]